MSTTFPQKQSHTRPPDIRSELERLFGFNEFRGKQEAVVAQVMAGVDTIAVMPTGAGKSLCYQLPAMLLPGMTVIISPLIALMKDQYDSLPAEVYERTTFINSSLEVEALTGRMDEILRGKYKLVYCAPERLRQQSFVDALRRANVSMLVVDEAHCVSMWGHDFRPDYLFLGKCLPLLGKPTVLALTATATPEMREEIAHQLGRPLRPVVASNYRANLYYEVETLADKEAKLRKLIQICKEESGSGVIYARSRDACEEIAAVLRRSGVQASHYHAGMSSEDRSRTQESFMLDRTRVIVATIAFGMGIDKSNVRWIVHFSPPDSLESYVQESGRAGRDGRPSRCILFITGGDRANLTRWKRQDALKVEDLRALYKELTGQLSEGQANYVNLEDMERNAGSVFKRQVDGTAIRVSISLLEKSGLITRHFDAPRSAWITLTAEGARSTDPQFVDFQRAAYLQQGPATRRDIGTLSTAAGVAPDELERRLLEWQEAGLITYRGDRREPVVERLRPPRDVAQVISGLLERRDSNQQKQIAQIIDYASARRCRHEMLAAHLGEQIANCDTGCDQCAPPVRSALQAKEATPELPDNPGQTIVECLVSFPFNVGRPSLVKALTGSAASNVNPERVRHFGSMPGIVKSSLDAAIDSLIDQGYIVPFESEEGYKLLRATAKAQSGVPEKAVSIKQKQERKPRQPRAERRGREEPRGDATWSPGGAQARSYTRLEPPKVENEQPPTPEEADLFERLRAWRRVVANKQNLPPYVIFHDNTLWAIARARPETEAELLAVKGVGQSHLAKYGPDLFNLINGE